MKKRKIFLLYPYYWPHYKAGGPVQSLYNLVDCFQHEAEFYLLSHERDIDGKLSERPLTLNQWVEGPNGEHIYYTRDITGRLLYRLMKELKPDIIFINGLFYMDTSLCGLVIGRLTNQRIAISPRGMLQDWALARRRKTKQGFLKLFKLLMGKNIQWHATDEKERDDIHQKIGRDQPVHVALNIPRKVSSFHELAFPGSDGKIKLVFLSLINPNKNLHVIIDEVNKAPSIFSLDIYGPIMDEAYWKDCQRRIKDNSPIYYHGAVSAWDVPQTLQPYHFFLLPTQGENFGHAIFDAMSCGVPVIIPRTTPWQDLEEHDAGIYFDIHDKKSLGGVLHAVAAIPNERYIALRKGSLAYARHYTQNRNFKEEYAFLIES